MKKYFRAVGFLICFLIALYFVNGIFIRKELSGDWDMTNKIHGFYNEPENSFDVMFFGSSHMYCSANPALLWEKEGIPSYVMASPKQPIWSTYHYIKEGLKRQRLSLVVMDIRSVIEKNMYLDDATNHTASDYLPFSFNKLQMITTLEPKKQWINYILPFSKFHSRWDQLTGDDFDLDYLDNRDMLKGYVFLDKATVITQTLQGADLPATKPIDKAVEYINKIIELCKDENVPLLLMKSPSFMENAEQERFNYIWQLARDAGVEYIDYGLMLPQLGLDCSADFYDSKHLNYKGVQKFTEHLAPYLKNTFSLPDRRGNVAYTGWDDTLEAYNRRVMSAGEY